MKIFVSETIRPNKYYLIQHVVLSSESRAQVYVIIYNKEFVMLFSLYLCHSVCLSLADKYKHT